MNIRIAWNQNAPSKPNWSPTILASTGPRIIDRVIAIAFSAIAPNSWSLPTSAGMRAERTGDPIAAADPASSVARITQPRLTAPLATISAVPAITAPPMSCVTISILRRSHRSAQAPACRTRKRRRKPEGEHHQALDALASQQPVEHQPAEHEALGVGDEEERDVVEPEVPERPNAERIGRPSVDVGRLFGSRHRVSLPPRPIPSPTGVAGCDVERVGRYISEISASPESAERQIGVWSSTSTAAWSLGHTATPSTSAGPVASRVARTGFPMGFGRGHDTST